MMGEWIGINKKKPNENQAVLVYTDDKNVFVCRHSHDQKFIMLDCSHWSAGHVVYWMPLPEPPKPEGPFCFADSRVKFIKDGEAIAAFMVCGASEPVVEKVIEWVNKMLATANLEDSPRPEGPFSWKDSDRRALLFRKGGFHRGRIELTLVVSEIAALRDWLNTIWALHKP